MNDELLQPPKGFRDYPPEEEIIIKKMLKTIETELQNYGFLPMRTSSIQNHEVLAGKFANSEETDVFKEIYFFEDKGGRKLGLRYDLTVPLGRIMASNPKMTLPFKRYEIGTVWRDGPVKLGRLREFTQCDADIVGIESQAAEAELLALATSILKKLEIKFKIELGNRKILESLLDYCEIKDKKAMITIDKLKKIGVEGVKQELKERGIQQASIEKIKKYIQLKGEEALQQLEKTLTDDNGKKGVEEVKQLLEYCKDFKIENIEFTPSLARGLDYYTGSVFELFFAESKITSSIGAGGRYENLIKNFGGRQIPATGITLGLDVIMEELKKNRAKTFIQTLVISIKALNKAIIIAQTLRENRISTIIDYNEKGLSKNLEYASKQSIPYVIIIGEQEIKQNKVTLRNMNTGEQKTLSMEQVIQQLQNA